MEYHEHVKKVAHHKMAKHDGGHHPEGSFDTAGMKHANEEPSHMGGKTIINHQEHQEGHMVHHIHHFGSHGRGEKS